MTKAGRKRPAFFFWAIAYSTPSIGMASAAASALQSTDGVLPLARSACTSCDAAATSDWKVAFDCSFAYVPDAIVRPANEPEYTALAQLEPALAPHGPLAELAIDRGYLASPRIGPLAAQGVTRERTVDLAENGFAVVNLTELSQY